MYSIYVGFQKNTLNLDRTACVIGTDCEILNGLSPLKIVALDVNEAVTLKIISATFHIYSSEW